MRIGLGKNRIAGEFMPIRTYYDLLGVSPTATEDELRAAYRRAMLRAHPDLNNSENPNNRNAKELNEAAAVLLDTAKRSRYDAFLERKREERESKATATTANKTVFEDPDFFGMEFAHAATSPTANSQSRDTYPKRNSKKWILAGLTTLALITLLLLIAAPIYLLKDLFALSTSTAASQPSSDSNPSPKLSNFGQSLLPTPPPSIEKLRKDPTTTPDPSNETPDGLAAKSIQSVMPIDIPTATSLALPETRSSEQRSAITDPPIIARIESPLSTNVETTNPAPAIAGAKAESLSKPRPEIQRLVGNWKHHVNNGTGSILQVQPDGSISNLGNTGAAGFVGSDLTWKWKQGGWIDTCRLVAQGNAYIGVNQNRMRIVGTRIPERGEPDSATSLAGGLGPNYFGDRGVADAVLVGLQTAVVDFDGKKCFQCIAPVYRKPDGTEYIGMVCGKHHSNLKTIGVKTGYVIQRIDIYADTLVHGLRLHLVKSFDRGSQPIVLSSGSTQKSKKLTLEFENQDPVGVLGSNGAVIDSLGLLTHPTSSD